MIRILALYSLSLLLAMPLWADSELDELLDQGKLAIDSKLSQSGTLVPGQRVNLVLTIATSNWFAGGTRIQIPEVPGLVILQTEQFAANASEVRGGQTWVVQRWTLDVYPQKAGNFTIPPISVSLKVNGGDSGNVSGSLLSPAVSFSVELPPALEQATFWVAAPKFSIDQRLDKDTTTLLPGDAFERRIEFKADDVLAMMLPEVREQEMPGLAAYPAPPVLENTSNRGQSTGSRVQIISYVAEQAGSYLLPAQDYFWWDTKDEEVRVLSLPAVEVRVSGTAGEIHSDESNALNPKILLSLLAGAALLALVAWLLYRFRPWRLLSTLAGPSHEAWAGLQDLRKPGLPPRLNPDSNAGD